MLNTDLALQSSKSRLNNANIPNSALVEIATINIFRNVLYRNLAIMLAFRGLDLRFSNYCMISNLANVLY